jgi:hypothetical protein
VTATNVEGKMSSYHHDLLSLEEEAKEDLRGLHAANGRDATSMRKIVWSPSPAEVEAILAKYKGKPVSVVVVRRNVPAPTCIALVTDSTCLAVCFTT